ncbi:MAG: hypothetical protein KDC66_17325, partial [Phaeodactylibacter sp.]|nr:hypothetical protein [Phaeodactylibacter sp.]MCB9273722.1 hypothetical protein [Lewinellaceae bacterium]
MAKSNNRAWNLEAFLDSFILELDKARETLALKGMSQPLTYAVKEVSLDLNLFPEYNGRDVKFTTAGPGEEGASRISIQLGSISDRQIRQTTKKPIGEDDIPIEAIEELDQDAKQTLRQVGISSIKDVEQLERQNVKLEKVPKIKEKMGDYQNLAERLKRIRKGYLSHTQSLKEKAEREGLQPRITRALLKEEGADKVITLEGDNLLITGNFQARALINQQEVEIIGGNERHLKLRVAAGRLQPGGNLLQIALDPYTLIQLNLS